MATVGDEAERSSQLAEELKQELYECSTCLEKVKLQQPIWSCIECFQIYHFKCIHLWGQTGRESEVVSCPHCRHTQPKPLVDHCFCGKVPKPKYDPMITPHSCGQTCERERPFCAHKCPMQCHPGPCPRCQLLVGPVSCPCGSTTYTYPCGQPDPETTCDHVCGKPLACGLHTCTLQCHRGPCVPCVEHVDLTCYCGKSTRHFPCTCETSFVCGEVCGKPLSCGNHTCTLLCHEGPCPRCPADPDCVHTCPCGAMKLTILRTSCLDPIPTCGQPCHKMLKCGQHRCQLTCHAGDCPPCAVRVETSCRCRKVRKRLPCAEAQTFTCVYECGTKLSCGRHKCKVVCCADRGKPQAESHLCFQVCGKQLPCGHTCAELCHASQQCPPCAHIVTTPLRCRCGAEVLRPPQPCGTQPPVCRRVCQIPRSCGHPVGHQCHYGPCPPCQTSVERICPRHHVAVTVPCGATEVTCEEACEALLPCGHRCNRICHTDPCVEDAHPCRQPCDRPHEDCGHRCTKLCHSTSPCPPCSVLVACTCPCGRISEKVPCHKIKERQESQGSKYVATVPCNDECFFNRRLEALASLSKTKNEKFLYSLFLWDTARRDLHAVQKAERQLSKFVEGSEQVASLPPTNSTSRALVHTLAKYFHVLSEGVDKEPQRSCLLTKTGSTSIPPVLLSNAVLDPQMDPLEFLAQRTKPSLREKLCLVVTGAHVSEILLSTLLSDLAGRYVIAPPEVNKDGQLSFLVAFTTQKRAEEAVKLLEAANTQHTLCISRATA